MVPGQSDDYLRGLVAMEAQGQMLRLLGLGGAPRREVTAALEEVFAGLVPRLKPGAVLEVGAHEARFSRGVRRRLPEVPVIAFEANPKNHARFAARAAAAGIDYRHCAVADVEGELVFQVPALPTGEQFSPRGSLMPIEGFDHVEEQRVPAVTLDSLGLERTVLWIDVEGAIGKIIAGGEATFGTALAVYVELEEDPSWPGQMLAHEALAAFARFGLVPVLRDVQRPAQFNVVLLRRSLVRGLAPTMEAAYFAALRRLAGIAAAPAGG